jgi:DNA-binding CsgD family transcriptional regulator
MPNQLQKHHAGKPLTARQVKLLRKVADGATYEEISAAEGIQRTTVQTEFRIIEARLGTHSQAQSVSVAYERNILSLPAERFGPSLEHRIALVHGYLTSGKARRLRLRLDISVDAVGAACGVHGRAVLAWEAHRHLPRPESLDAYYEVLRSLQTSGRLPD